MFRSTPFLNFIILASACATSSLQGGIVTNNADSGSGSLRSAIAASVNGETIIFDLALNGATITLTTGELVISDRQIIIDASALVAGVSVSGNNTSRVIQINGNSNVTIKKLDVRNGSANFGGGIALVESQLLMVDSAIRDSFAESSGGGIYLTFGTSAVFERCSISGNSCSALSSGGGINISGATSVLFRSCVVAGNSSPFGGGFAISNSSPRLINCTIQGNKGAGLRNESNADVILENSIVWGNSNPASGGVAAQQIENFTDSNPSITYCLIEGASSSASFADGNATVWGTNNLDGTLTSNNPKFAQEVLASSAPNSAGKLSLLTTSPALNVGSNSFAIGTIDLNGNPRVKDSIVDLGAYEGAFVTFAFLHPALSPTSDANGNSISNFQEYAAGFDPSAPDNASLRPTFSIIGNSKFLASSLRSNAADVISFWQTSTSLGLGTWQEMTQGTNYTIESVSNITPSRQEVVLRLLDGGALRFYRQAFFGN